MKIGSLFSGYGGLDQAVSSVTGAETVWVSDVDKGANKILAHRYPDVPNLGDITQIDFTTVEPIDILTGGFPCQDLSHAGQRAGLKEGTRSGLWSHMARAIKELQPRLVVVENVRGLLSADAPGDVEPCPWCVGDRSTVNLRGTRDCSRRLGRPRVRCGMGWFTSSRCRCLSWTVPSVPRSFGRPAPAPTEPTGKHGEPQLSPRFEEWMMGLPEGWVVDVPGLGRRPAMKALGNGVVPQQASAALAHLLGRSS